jgi:hypothetical protein
MALDFSHLLGAHPSKDDPRDAEFAFDKSEIFAGVMPGADASPSVVDAHDYREQRFQDCVGMTCVETAQTFFAVIGKPKPRLSPMLPYCGSRTLASPPQPGQLLADGGCSLRHALKWDRDVGFVSEDLWPETAENVGLTPPADVRDAAASARAVSAHRIIAPTLESFREQLRVALVAAKAKQAAPIAFIMPVHEAYFNIGSRIYDKPEGKIVGYHAQPVGGLDGPNDCVLVPGSWGRGFGDNGLARISVPCLYAIGSEFWVQVFDPNAFEVQ